MTCPELRRKWWHRLVIGVALVLATVSAGTVLFVGHDDSQAFWNVFAGPIRGPILVFVTVFFAIFIPYRFFVRIAIGKISS
jgi:hypothetical protein